MPSDGGVIAICEAYSTIDTPTTPVLVGEDNSRFLGSCVARVERAGSTGGGVLYGVMLPGTNGIPTDSAERVIEGRKILGSDDLGTGSNDRSSFVVDIPIVTGGAAALSGNNWICVVNDVSAGTRTCFKPAASAATSAGEFFVDVSEASVSVLLTIGAQASGGFIAAGDTVELYYVGAATALLTVSGQFDQAEIDGASVMWYDPDSNTGGSATNIYVSPTGQ